MLRYTDSADRAALVWDGIDDLFGASLLDTLHFQGPQVLSSLPGSVTIHHSSQQQGAGEYQQGAWCQGLVEEYLALKHISITTPMHIATPHDTYNTRAKHYCESLSYCSVNNHQEPAKDIVVSSSIECDIVAL